MLAFGWESLLDTTRKKGRMPLTCGSHLAETKGAGWLLPLSRELGPGGEEWRAWAGKERKGGGGEWAASGERRVWAFGQKEGEGVCPFYFLFSFLLFQNYFQNRFKNHFELFLNFSKITPHNK
jgi:hypothetical protein